MARRKSGYMDYGIAVLDRLIKTLIIRDKVRQIQTITLNRRKVPIRIVWAEDIDETTLVALEQDVDLALMNPDFSIITNYQVNWEEIGVNDRIFDGSPLYDYYDRRLSIGLGLPYELLSGEGTFAGNYVNMNILNAEIELLRSELIQRFFEDFLFKPVAYKKGFFEIDKWGNEKLLYPKVKFNRPAITDVQTLIDQMFNLYQKGSFPVQPIIELLGEDPEAVEAELKKDFMTINDAMFNRIVEQLAGAVGDKIANETNIADRVIAYLGLKMAPVAPEGGGEEEGLGELGMPAEEGELGASLDFKHQRPKSRFASKKYLENALIKPRYSYR